MEEEQKVLEDTEEVKAEAEQPAGDGLSRRTVCFGLGAAAALCVLGGAKYLGSTPVVRPPGGQDEDHLISSCIHCEKCMEACPHDIIVPSHLENGLLGIRTPELDFSVNYCDWCADANNGVPLCVQDCPTGALSLASDATIENTIIGVAEITTDWCLAYKLISCRFCYDACNDVQREAIVLDENNCPSILADKCNGCGACESVCSSMRDASISSGATHRAIIVKPLEA